MDKAKDNSVEPIQHQLLTLNNNVNNLNVTSDFKAPVLENYEQVYQNVKAVHDKYNKVVIPNAKEANAINKRGGVLTQMRKVVRKATQMRTSVHREAKNSYSDFDDKINNLIELVNSSIDHLTIQVNHFKEQQQAKRFEEIKVIFKDECLSYQFKNISQMFIDFDEFYQHKYLNENKYSDAKLKELMTNYLVQKYHDNEATLKFFKENPDIATVKQLVVNFKHVYQTNYDVNEAIANTLQAKKELDKLIAEQVKAKTAQKIAEANAVKQKANEQLQTNNVNDVNTNKKNTSAKVSFEIYDLSQLNLIKTFLNKNKIKFTTHFLN